jgi:cytochrome P450
MAELVRNPRVMKKAQTEVRTYFKGLTNEDEMDLSKLNYMHLVIKETLRLHPPAPIIARRQIRQETCIIYGYDIPKGTIVLVNVWAIGNTCYSSFFIFYPSQLKT